MNAQDQRSGKRLLSWAIFLLLPLLAQAEPTSGLKIRLISSTEVIVPGKPFTVGFHIQHDKGFHTYWKNPGMVGLATGLKWTLPEGFTASELQWPYPELTHMAEYPCHGYERDVTLLTTIFPPKEVKTKTVTLKTDAQWMCCSRECYPGFKDFSITLPIGDKVEANDTSLALIQKAKSEIPPFTKHWRIEVLSKADESPIKLRLRAHPKSKPTYLFSKDGQISSDQKQTFVKEAEGTWLFTIARSEYSPKGKKALPLVLQAGKHYHAITTTYAEK